jgi:HEAT repeat protein
LTHPVVARLRDPDPAVRREACRAAADDPSAVLLVDALGEALADRDGGVWRAASEALAKLAPHHEVVAELLRRALHGGDPRMRWGAAFTKARLAPPEPGLLPALVEALASRESDVQWAAARILVDLGRLHHQALPVAVGLARTDPNPDVRRMALFCLRELAPDEPATVDALLEASRDADRQVRRAALASMAALQAPPQEIAERLTQVLEDDPDPAARRLAAAALAVVRR